MDTRLNIVVVEDHEDSKEQMLLFLNREGFLARGADCGEELNRLLREQNCDIVILDLNLPHEDGLSIAKRLKETHPKMGVVILSARTRAVDRLLGYQTGADVYLQKPVNLDEVKAVLDNLSTRLNLKPIKQSIVLNLSNCILTTLDQTQVKLTQAEARLLRLLAQMPSREADVEFLLEAMSIKDQEIMTKESLRVHASRVRSKVPDLENGVSLVSSIRGFGYRLNAPVTLI